MILPYCKLETQKSRWYSLKYWEPGTLRAGKDWCFNSLVGQRERISPLFFHLSVSQAPHRLERGGGQSTLRSLTSQRLISSGNTITNTYRNNVWISRHPVVYSSWHTKVTSTSPHLVNVALIHISLNHT